MEKPLFIPLTAQWFDAFASGAKTEEFRPYGPRWNERTCAPGRPVTLSRGYGKASRLSGTVADFRVVDAGADPAIRTVYPAGDRFAAIKIDLSREESRMQKDFERAGFAVVSCEGNELDLELPNRDFKDECGLMVAAVFNATVTTDADGTVIELEHVSHGSPLRAVYGATAATAAVAAKLAAEEWIETINQAAERGDHEKWR